MYEKLLCVVEFDPLADALEGELVVLKWLAPIM